MALPYLIYYFKKYKSPYPEGTSKVEMEKVVLYRMLDYHYSYGHSGFLSERSTLEGIFQKLPVLLEREWETYTNPPLLEIDKVAVNEVCLHETKKLIESQEDFVRWYEDYFNG